MNTKYLHNVTISIFFIQPDDFFKYILSMLLIISLYTLWLKFKSLRKIRSSQELNHNNSNINNNTSIYNTIFSINYIKNNVILFSCIILIIVSLSVIFHLY